MGVGRPRLMGATRPHTVIRLIISAILLTNDRVCANIPPRGSSNKAAACARDENPDRRWCRECVSEPVNPSYAAEAVALGGGRGAESEWFPVPAEIGGGGGGDQDGGDWHPASYPLDYDEANDTLYYARGGRVVEMFYDASIHAFRYRLLFNETSPRPFLASAVRTAGGGGSRHSLVAIDPFGRVFSRCRVRANAGSAPQIDCLPRKSAAADCGGVWVRLAPDTHRFRGAAIPSPASDAIYIVSRAGDAIERRSGHAGFATWETFPVPAGLAPLQLLTDVHTLKANSVFAVTTDGKLVELDEVAARRANRKGLAGYSGWIDHGHPYGRPLAPLAGAAASVDASGWGGESVTHRTSAHHAPRSRPMQLEGHRLRPAASLFLVTVDGELVEFSVGMGNAGLTPPLPRSPVTRAARKRRIKGSPGTDTSDPSHSPRGMRRNADLLSSSKDSWVRHGRCPNETLSSPLTASVAGHALRVFGVGESGNALEWRMPLFDMERRAAGLPAVFKKQWAVHGAPGGVPLRSGTAMAMSKFGLFAQRADGQLSRLYATKQEFVNVRVTDGQGELDAMARVPHKEAWSWALHALPTQLGGKGTRTLVPPCGAAPSPASAPALGPFSGFREGSA